LHVYVLRPRPRSGPTDQDDAVESTVLKYNYQIPVVMIGLQFFLGDSDNN